MWNSVLNAWGDNLGCLGLKWGPGINKETESVDNTHPLYFGFHIKLQSVYVIIDLGEKNTTNNWARNQETGDEVLGLALDTQYRMIVTIVSSHL